LPEEICDLILLKEIRVDYNFLNNFPSGLHRLSNLVFFSASHNLLKQIPSSLMILNSKLEFLHLNDNKIS
jgi:Leucine-rich repeat (LRR) protein